MGNNFSYYVHGFTLQSEIECPELMPADCGNPPDILVRLGALDHPVDEVEPWKGRCIEQGHMLLNTPDAGRFSVRDGRDIIVDPLPGAPDVMLRLYLLGSALGCILHQRGLLPLHANAFLHADEAVLVLAHSGTGKSTLAAAMQARGCQVLSDDVCAVRVTHGEAPVIFPGVPQIKLWKDAAAHLGQDVNTLRRALHEEEKYALPIPHTIGNQHIRIKAIYILHANDDRSPSMRDMTLIEKLRALQNHTYRKGIVSTLGIEAINFKACAALAECTRMRRVFRPKNGFLLDELADLLERDLL